VKFIVAQVGARRGYAVPAILEKAGMLDRFYTDVTGDIGLGAVFSAAAVLPFVGKSARRLAARRLPFNIRAKTTTFPGISLVHALREAMVSRDPAAECREGVRFSDALGTAMARCGFGGATHMYSMLGECGPLFAEGKRRGLVTVSEIYIPLSTERILTEERKKFPGWEDNAPDYAAVCRGFESSGGPRADADFAICPSEWVRDDLVRNFAFPSRETAIVPYGINPELFSVRNEPMFGRILFAGTADLRKGIHYLAMAAEKLIEHGFHYEFRVGGNVEQSVANQRQCRYLTFLGRVPRVGMTREFAATDLFVLPSLAEGSAETTYEALACGVPVVTTLEAGSVVRDCIDGRIVASRDPEALANAIVEIVEDRQKREQMSHAARDRAHEYTWERYGERLLTALRQRFEDEPIEAGVRRQG
jgi:glycosyltransferase involved in cell wall biosynthesis